MIELGKYQKLKVLKKTGHGFYLGESSGSGHQILLPKRDAPEGLNVEDEIEVFVYKDSEDREIATAAKVPVTIGGLAVLRVKEVSHIGAFLDWGLAKDLLLPYKEQTAPLAAGDEVLVTLYVDKSSRLCATMKVYELLSSDSPYKRDDVVEGIVYEIIDAFGAFVAVDNKYSALVPVNELFKPLKAGDKITARVANVRDDGKLTLSLRAKSYLQMDADSEIILKMLKESGGFLPYNDGTNADIIKADLHMSKNAFKRAIGRLYKNGAITITDDGIRLLK